MVTVTRSMVTSVALFSRPPPSNARLFEIVVSAITTSPALLRLRPPPSSVASLLSIVERTIVIGPPSDWTPPPPATSSLSVPSSSTIGTPALLKLIVESAIVCIRSLCSQTPPPSPFEVLAVTVTKLSSRLARPSLAMAAPWSDEWFRANVLLATTMWASPSL